MPHEHDLDAEYLYPSDARVLDLYQDAAGHLRMAIAVPCPECDAVLELDAEVETVDELDLDVPLADADLYD